MKHQFLVAVLLLAAFAVAEILAAAKYYRIIESIDKEESIGDDEEFDSKVDKRQASPRRGCGPPPNPGPINALISTPIKDLKTWYNVSDSITYRCNPPYMRLLEGYSPIVTCLANGTWTQLPVCQSYTYSCRRNKLAREYKGRVNRTRCGQPCQAWNSDTPQLPAKEVKAAYSDPRMFPDYRNVFEAQNYCRNPDGGETSGPWCYINQAGANPRWGYCDVTYCDAFDVFDEYDRVPGACGCQGEWYNAIRNYGNIKSIEDATLKSCKAECDSSNQCQGMVFDENQNKCWLKKCSCTDQEVVCTNNKHETYYRKKTPPCPGLERYDRYGQRVCYFSLFNFNLNSTLTFDWQTSRQLCQSLFPVVSDIVALETDEEWNFLANNIAQLRIPVTYNRLWLGLYRPENVSDYWQWADISLPPNTPQRPLNYSRWAPGEPTNGYEEQCTQVVLAAGPNDNAAMVGRWADESCRFKAPVICEAKMPNWRVSKREYQERSDEEIEQRHDSGYKPHCKTAECGENESQ